MPQKNAHKKNFSSRAKRGFIAEASVIKIRAKEDNYLKFYISSTMARFRAETLFTKERSTIAWLDKIQQADIFLDIGANVGTYTIYAGAITGCRVIAIEPESQNYSVLCKNISLNELHEIVTPYCCALSNENKVGVLHLSHFKWDGAGSCVSFNEELDHNLNYKRSEFSKVALV